MAKGARAVWLLSALLLGGVQDLGLAAGAQTTAATPLQLRVRRMPDSLDLVIEGTGASPQLLQTSRGSTWLGRLTTTTQTLLPLGPQRLSLPEAGLQAISLEGGPREFRLEVVPLPGMPLNRPVVSADGRNLILSFNAPAQASLQTLEPNAAMPGRLPQAAFVPPLQPRAVAPPLGDMAVGTMMLSNPSYVNVSGPPVTMTLRNAPAKDVLMALSQLGGYGFVYVDDVAAPDSSSKAASGGGSGSGSNSGSGAATSATLARNSPGMRPISIAFRRESYGRAINSTLMAAGLQGKRDGNTIFAGPNVLAKSFGAQMSKVYRLNQVSANSAADYLASLGATISKTFTTTSVSSQTQSTGTPIDNQGSQQTQTARTTAIESYGASQGPLRGLIGTTDSRLGTVTLVGDPRVVMVAESYLKQLDLRQRQVALSVKILDVDLTNDAETNNSFAYRWGNGFIVNAGGRLVANFGNFLPPGSAEGGLPSPYTGADGTSPSVGTGQFNGNGFLDRPLDSSRFPGSSSNLPGFPQAGNFYARPDYGTYADPGRPGVSDIDSQGKITFKSPTRFSYPANQLFDLVQAQIVAKTTKVLASPTLILQENPSLLRDDSSGVSSGTTTTASRSSLDSANIDSPIGRKRGNEGIVRVGIDVPTKVSVTQSGTIGSISCSIDELTTSGLVLGARIEKIDDNGFVTFALSPSISAVRETIPSGGNCPPISILAVRKLDTGAVRVRDGQTLILTGVISDEDRSEITKWPILGDVPFVGQFFRNTTRQRNKRELVIMVTPRIINDQEGGVYGYGYQPGTSQARELLRGS